MNWDTNNCPTHFCHAFHVLLAIRVLTENMLPSFFMLGLQSQMSTLCLWFVEAHLQAASSCSNPCLEGCHPLTSPYLAPPAPVVLEAPYPADAGSTSSQTEPEELQVASQVIYRTRHKLFTSAPFLLQALCPVPTQKVMAKICSPLGSNGFYDFSICCECLTPK